MLAAIDAASRSEDPQTQTGTSLFSSDWKPLGTGCNGFDAGFVPDPSVFDDRAKKSALIHHAEVNAIKNCNKSQPIHYLASLLTPCPSCTALIKGWGVKEVFYLNQYIIPATGKPDEAFRAIFDFAGIKCRAITEEEKENIRTFTKNFALHALK